MIAFVNDNVVTSVRNSVTTSSGLSFANTQSNLAALLSSPPAVRRPGLQSAAHAGRQLRDLHHQRHRHPRSEPRHALRAPVELRHPAGREGHHRFRRATSATRAAALLRAIDYNQVLYNANGFLADFLRAQNNAASGGKGRPRLRRHLQRQRGGQRAAHGLPAVDAMAEFDQRDQPDLPPPGSGGRTGQPVHGEQDQRLG